MITPNQAIAGLVVVLASVGLYSAYDFAYDRGYQAKSIEVNKFQSKQADALTKLSNDLASIPAKIVENAAINNANVLLAVKNRPLFVIDKEGKCLPSKDFDKAYRELLK